MSQRFVAVDIGGTQIRAALCDAAGEIHRRAADLTRPEDGADAVMDRIEKTIRSVCPPDEQIAAIGVASPGPLDPQTGVVLEAPNIPCWENYPLREIIQERLDVPTRVGNDANLAALAEHRFGAGQGSANLIYITVSTGVGGGIIVDNRLLVGEHGLAGEIGHIKVRPDGPLCGCGHPGCLEAQASGPSIAREAQKRIRTGKHSLALELAGGDPEAVSARILNLAAQKGDAMAVEVFRQAGSYLGLGLVTLLHLFDPDTIVIGGSVSKAGHLLLAPAQELVRQQAMTAHYWRNTSIVAAALGDDVGLLGALALVLGGQR